MRCWHERGWQGKGTGRDGPSTSHPSQMRDGWDTRDGAGMSEVHRVGEARTGLVVMKFGGTSLEDAAAMLRTAAIVRGRREKGLSPVVVVAAMAKVTDQLLAAAAAAGRGDKTGALAISARLRNRQLDTAGAPPWGAVFTPQ